MPNLEPIIQCSNPHCIAFNEINRRFCKQCKTPVIKRYLWAIGHIKSDSEARYNHCEPHSELTDEEITTKTTDSLVTQRQNQRYLPFGDRIFLDTQPGETPQIADKLTDNLVSYLQLFPHFPHIPQVYGQLDGTQTWLLDYGTVPISREGKLVFSDLLPKLTAIWTQATSLKQLNWLRQIANLWKPLAEKGMTATLLNPELIRINVSFVQLLELEANQAQKPTFQDLGRLWQDWSQQANSDIQDFLGQLSQKMAKGTIDRIEQILLVLDRAIKLCSQFDEYSYESYAISDSGPKRSNNQDTAYPNSETPIKKEAQHSLTIVCDGVGGHEGGEIASQETVAYLCDRINNTLTWDEPQNNSTNILNQLLQFTNEVNDVISKRNDSEKRQDRQRMGTTLVMALAHHHEVFLSHIGDSRIYLITRDSCHQLTTDDDLASREVRLGYAVYRDALKYPSAGALIQALGMRHSGTLHPNLQRLIIDDDCLFLLCTDGLSDYDRVEQYWRDVIAPVLENQSDITKAVKTLVKIGNERNGHDNVTAALIHCQIKPKLIVANKMISWSEVESSVGDLLACSEEIENSILPQEAIATISDTLAQDYQTNQKSTKLQKNSKNSKSPYSFFVLALSVAFVVSFGFLIYTYTKNKREQQNNPPLPELSQPEAEIDR